MIRSDGRVIEWHCVRAAPRKTKALAATAAGKPPSTPRRRTTKTDKQKLRSRLYNLALDISTLRQQIHDLHETRSLLYTRALHTKYDGDGSLVRRTQAFVDLTRPGYGSLDDPPTLAAFLSALSEDITFGPFVGRDQLVTSWRGFSRHLQTTHLVIHAIRVVAVDSESERCTVRLDSTSYNSIKSGALEALYPAVLHDPELTAAILGMPLPLSSVIHITFDRACQIVQYDPELDLVGALTQLTADARRAGELLEQAASEKRGLPYHLEALEIKYGHPIATPRVEIVWGLDRDGEPESLEDVEAQEAQSTVNRHAVEFILS